jgi:DNA polymerase-3 subunit alpha
LTQPTTDGSGFVHLHVHGENSQLDGLGRVKTLPKTAAALGQKAMALTDHGSLAGAWKFQKNCVDAGIKPIIGCEMYMAIGSRHKRNFETVANDDDNAASDADEGKEKVKRYMHLTVLARNEDGWKSLLALHNKAEDSYWYKPRIDFDLLDEHGKGLIILTGCLGGPVAGPLARAGAADKARDPEAAAEFRKEARANLDRLINAVGREHVFIEVMYHGIKAEAHAYRELRTLSEETGIPLVATNDCHYEHAHEAPSHDGLLAVGVKRSLDDPNRFRFNGTPDYYVKSEAEMLDVLGEVKNEAAAAAWREAVANTVKVAALCADTVIPEPKMRLPKYPVPAGFASEQAYLHHLVVEGAKERFGAALPQEVKERLRTEEDIINQMGFPAYFLLVWDIIAWARSDYSARDWVDRRAGKIIDEATRVKKKPILVGVGRGSAAGSLTSYCLKIVGVDPLENHLLFERFLEPDRKGMPDIDVDFEAGRRGEVFNYVVVSWGANMVAHIGTFGMALSKAAIKDAARILKPSATDRDSNMRGAALQKLGNQLSDMVPSAGGKAYSFAQLDNTADNATEAFRQLVADSGQDAQDILELARAFEGITKTESIHACGFIISPEPLDEIVPMRWQSHAATADPDAPRVICWDGGDCEEIGLLKMDILGLTNLDIAAQALDYIESTTGNRFSLEEIPHPSTKGDAVVEGAYALMAAGRTGGVFQMESGGMIRTAQEVVPETLDDISAIVALFRPGPLKAGMHTAYARRKAGLEEVTYTDFTRDPVETEWIDSVLGATYGMAIYQETIMRLSTVVAGFNGAQRSRLRKAMGKKKQSEMDACLDMWTEGATVEVIAEDGTLISPKFAPATAAKLWEFISGAASYLFNASHSAAYGQLAYYTAYLKSGWPVQYAASILAVADKDEKRLTALSGLRDDGIEVLSPDVNKSMERTAPVDGKVLLGLSEIKDVGSNGVHIVNERISNGPFTSLADLVERVKVPSDMTATGFQKVPAAALQGLIEAGALDEFGPRLGQLMAVRAVAKNPDAPIVPAQWDALEEATRQRQRLGVSLGIHPLVSKKDKLNAWRTPGVYDERTGESVGTRPVPLHKISDDNGAAVVTLGVISMWEEKAYGGGRRANFSLESSRESINGVIWDRTLSGLRRKGTVPKIGDIVAVSGKVSVRSTVIGDEESGTEETIRTKELNIFEMWPVATGDKPDVPVEAGDNVVSFTDLYQKLRSAPLLPPEPPKDDRPEPAKETLAPVVKLDDRRQDKEARQDAFVRIGDLGAHRIGSRMVSGPKSIVEKFAAASVPETKTIRAGDVYRCNLKTGHRIFVLVQGGGFEPAEMEALVRSIDDESRWAPAVSKETTAGIESWHRLVAASESKLSEEGAA